LVERCTTEFFLLFFQQATGTMYPLLCIFCRLEEVIATSMRTSQGLTNEVDHTS